MNKITLHVNSLCHTDKLGMEIELPEHPDLCEAIMTINKYCSEEVERRKKDGPFLMAFDGFPFEKVCQYMKVTDWKWSKLGRSPNVEEAKEHVKSLYNSLDSHSSDNIGSGGFWVIKNNEEVRIEFTISSHGYRDIE